LARGSGSLLPPPRGKFGLKVGKGIDERTNIPKETDAAMRYLASLYLRFENWGLAVASYNQGETAIQDAIDETGERDPWKLEKQGKIGTYLPQVFAAALILRNPSMLN